MHLQSEIQLTLVGTKFIKLNVIVGAAFCPDRYNMKAGESFIVGGNP